MNLHPIANPAPKNEPVVHVYNYKIVLNAKASALLNLVEGSRVSFVFDEDAADRGKRVFVGKVADGGIRVRRRGNTFFINNQAMSGKLAGLLEGFGTYRIDSGYVERNFNREKFYNIFFRKYD